MESVPSLTSEDYFRSQGDQRWELLGGEAFAMSPAPSAAHQRVVGNLFFALKSSLKGSVCETFVSPIDVKLSTQDVVQPDVVVVCDATQVVEAGIDGIPKLVIEVVSPSSLRHDRIRKFNLYASVGVAEYWLVSPYPPMLEVFAWTDEGYRAAAMLSDQDRLESPAFPFLSFPLTDIFGPATEVPGEVREGLPPAYQAAPPAL